MKVNRLAVKLNNKAERAVKKGHPWVFSDSILKLNKEGNAGDLAIMFDSKNNKVFAIGLYDPDSPIRIKVLHRGPAQIDASFFREKIQIAYDLRSSLISDETNAYRLLFGENDGLPGLVLDVYNKKAVLKLYSSIWFPYLENILNEIVELADLDAVILRMSRNVADKETKYKEGQILWGNLDSSEVIFNEYGVRFKTDLIKGHKTGFFLDHRENRHEVGKKSKGKTVLDVFSYSGGFTTHALVGGAKEVTSIDFSEQALALAEENVKLNPHSGKHNTIAGDAFEILRRKIQENKKYDIVILDPPSFANSQDQIDIAKKKYAELADLGARLTNKGGVLLLASCSSRVNKEEFYDLHQKQFERMRLSYKLLKTTEHAVDHPINFEEGAYLKSAYYKIR